MCMPKLIILCGLPGSGKTTYAIDYIKKHGGYRLSSDENLLTSAIFFGILKQSIMP